MDKQSLVRNISYCILLLSLTACGGGGGSSTPAPTSTPPPVSPPATPPVSVSGGGVKGPLANAVVTVYAFDASQPGFKGSVAATASTNASAAITGLALPSPVTPPYIMEFTSTPGTTTDITTGQFPVITTLRTVITQTLLDGGDPLYATPLTTMAVDIAVSNATDTNGTAGIQADEFETALTVAASQVVSTLGFGLDGSVDIFDTPPLVDSTTTSTQQQADVAAYRAAVEAVTAIAFQINQQSSGGDTDSVLTELANDLANDGRIDGNAGSQINASTLQVLQQDPATLPIPNSPTNQTVADVQTILVSEASTTAPSTSVTALGDGSINTTPAAAETNPDLDGDGVLNADDAFPNDSSESVDSDGDGIGDNADTDDNNNGILDIDEGQPVVVTATDSDGDGDLDVVDNCPAIFNPAQTNTDEFLTVSDALGDACDTDDDGDGVLDTADAFPLDENESIDTDSDGTGNVADTDDDNDGVLDINDTGLSPLDGTACSLLIDCDGDGVFDSADFAPVDPAVTVNFAPVTNNSSVSTDEDAVLTVNLSFADDGIAPGSLAFNITGPVNGGLSGAAPNLTYTPNAEFNGTDSFTFTATDSDGKTSNVSTVSITVNSINDLPVISQAGPLAVNMDEDGAPVTFVAPVINATDADAGDTLTWSLSNSATSGVASVSGTGASPTVTYAPSANFNGSDSFEAQVVDANGGTDVVTINVTVSSQNDAPVIVQIGPIAVVMDEDSSPVAFVAPVISASDVDSAILTWSGTAATNGTATVSGTGASPAISYAPGANYNGPDSFDVTVSDGVLSRSVTISVTVNTQNDIPVVNAAGPFSIAENTANAALVGAVNASDADGSITITGYSITAGNTGGAFAISPSGQLSVLDTTAIDYETSTSFNLTITATDGIDNSAGEVVIVNITDVNDTAPVVTAAGPFSLAENAANATAVGTAINATDIDSVVTGYSITAGNTGGAFVISSTGQITVADTTAIDYESAASFNLTITATDGVTPSAGEIVVVNITDVNDTAPVIAAAQTFNVISTAVNGDVVGTVSASDVDTVGAITAFSITGTEFAIDANGQITVADASILVTNGPAYNPTVDATDGVNTSLATAVTINVVNNQPPVIDQGASISVIMDEDGSPTAFVAPVITATDAENDSLSWATLNFATSGQAVVNGQGVGSTPTISYFPDADFNGSASFVIRVTDGTSADTITVNVTVNPVNDAPTISGSPATGGTVDALYSFTPVGDDIDGTDTLAYSITGKPSWATFDTATGTLSGTPAAGDATTYSNIVISVTDGNSSPVALAPFSITVGTGVDLTGVWNFTFTSDPAQDLPSAGCSGSQNGDTESILVAIKQTGTSLVIMVEGDQLAGGAIDVATGAFNITGLISSTVADLLDTVDPKFEDITTTETMTFAATGTTGGTITGTSTIDDGVCSAFENITASFIYRPTGAENYNGVYAFESSDREEYSNNPGVIDTYNEGFPLELEIVGNVMNVYLPDAIGANETESISANTFDPLTGYFTFTVNYTEKQDNNPNVAGFEFSRKEIGVVNGIFVGDPAVTPGGNGLPIVFLSARTVTYEYIGDFDNGGTLSAASNASSDIYGKRLITRGSTRTRLIEKGNQTSVSMVRLGLQSPPLKRQDTANSDLYLQVFDGATLLCEGPFADDGTGSFLYYEQINQPDPDFATQQFRGGPYSSVNCNTSLADGTDQVTTGVTYTIRILDTGSDGVKGTADDAIMFDSDVDFSGGYQAEVADPVDRYTQTPNVFDIKVNGAKASTTMGGSLLPLYGYFDAGEAISVSWPAQEAVTDNYQIRLREAGDFINNRYGTSTTNVQLPAFALNNYGPTSLRLFAIGAAAGTPNAKAVSVSRAIEIQPGVRGLFNIELGKVIPAEYRTMQVYLEGDDFGLAACMVTNNPLLTCSGGSVDFTADTVTLNMVDSMNVLGTAGNFTLVLHFKPDNVAITSARAVVTSSDEAGIPSVVDANPALWTTAARAVNSELEIRSQRLSNGKIRTLIMAINPLGGAYDKAIFKSDTTANIFTDDFAGNVVPRSAPEVLWDDRFGTPLSVKVDKFIIVPTDDNLSQIAGGFTIDGTTGWGYGFDVVLKADTYRAVALDTDTGEPSIVFRNNYAANNPAAYVAPVLSNVVVDVAGTSTNCVTGSICTSASAIDTSANAGIFNLQWTVPTPPANSRWWLFVNNTIPGGVEVRTRRMLPDAVGSEITSSANVDGTTTYTWTNPGDIVAPAGEVLEINISVTSGESGSGFTNIGAVVQTDRVHVMQNIVP